MLETGSIRSLALCALLVACADTPGVTPPEPGASRGSADGVSRSLDGGSIPAPNTDIWEEPPPRVSDLGEPCAENDGCASGFCVEGPKGSVCTQTCIDDCPSGYLCKGVTNSGADITFLCVPMGGALCKPCTADVQCNGGRCAEVEGQGACTILCQDSTDCLVGYACDTLVSVDGASTFEGCIPPNHTCSCDAETAGLKRSCAQLNENGECAGIETCDPEIGWSGCDAPTPFAEGCDGVDNDCDGLIDEGLPINQTCFNNVEGVGACQGLSFCAGPGGWVCQADTPSTEACDYVDNDCDGAADEDFKVAGAYGTLEHCGACGKSCVGSVPNGTPACILGADGAPPTCGVASCEPGFFFVIGGKQCLPELQTLCQPCASAAQCYYPGAACLSLEDGSFCTKPCAGQADCPAGFECSPVDGFEAQCVPSTASCTCDGSNPTLQRECTQTAGGAGGPLVTCTGYEPCTADGWGACVLPDDVCDSVDNDCDGSVDEAYKDPDTGKYTTAAHCGQCNNSCELLDFANANGACDASPPIPACTMVCKPGFVDVNDNPNDGCECTVVGALDKPYGGDANCDGVDGEVGNAIFVSKDGSDANPGTLDAPVFSIAKGITRAKAAGKRDVYVATGVYVEAISLQAGVAVYGGYSADFVQHVPEVYETAILGPPPPGGLVAAVNADSIGGPPGSARFDGFSVFGADGVGEGASSYAVYLKNCTAAVAISNCRIFAGDGAPGADGDSGGKGATGDPGLAGKTAYDINASSCGSSHHNAGAAGGGGACGGTSVAGGQGGKAICPDYDTSGSQPKSDPISQTAATAEGGKAGSNNSGGFGAGGSAGFDGGIFKSSTNCAICHIPPNNQDTVGGTGGHGKDGAGGKAGGKCGDQDGAVSPGGLWFAASGGDAGAGKHGGGGGGGGAGGGVETQSCASSVMKYDDVGGSGGGGGAGACGGTGGSGGGGAGGSFGIFVVHTGNFTTLPELSDNVVTRGLGGNGGHGGQGGVGGAGGSGGEGGASGAAGGWKTFCAPNGGTGGDGGDGGHGGGGAGGCGGVSYGVFASGAPAASLSGLKAANSVVAGGSGGLGGPGGDSAGKPGPNGVGGATAKFNF